MSTSALQVARTGLDAQSDRMRIIANNLANVNTTAFQRDRAEFATLAYQTVQAAGARSSGESQFATGLNLVTVSSISGIPLTKMMTSNLPFIAIELVMIYLLYFFPQLTLFLPAHMSMH